MLVIEGRNVNDCWRQAQVALKANHVVRPSRVGEVLEYPTPVVTVYQSPTERVLFDPVRDCNPFFHLMESLWMLSGRNDVKWLTQFLPRMADFSDDGKTFNGAYGYRWRRHFIGSSAIMNCVQYADRYGRQSERWRHIGCSIDQIYNVVGMLRKSHNERRAVIAMWDPAFDLNPKCKDIPCNIALMFKVREGKLTMTVCNRSNDIRLGLYGANAVHMSMLQEVVASMVGVKVGPMHTISDSFHAYTETWKGSEEGMPPDYNLYNGSDTGFVTPYPVVSHPDYWFSDLDEFMECTESGHSNFLKRNRNKFFYEVAVPVFLTWKYWKLEALEMMKQCLNSCQAADWQLACHQWTDRRIRRRELKRASSK